MIKTICLAASLFALGFLPVSAQDNIVLTPASTQPAKSPPLTKFSLDFPGGSPSQLIEAIQKTMGKPLNVIINKEDEDTALPPLKMNDVIMPQLFQALESASHKTVAVSTSDPQIGRYNSYSQMITSYGFNTSDRPVTDTSVWYFHVDRPSLPPLVSTKKVCQFYPLLAYLDRGFTVDDITTAIQTGWKLSGETTPPELNYHKETKLLIAYGDPSELMSIDRVLQSLPSENVIRLRDQNDHMAEQIQKLQQDVYSLKKAAPAPATEAPAIEKSGK